VHGTPGPGVALRDIGQNEDDSEQAYHQRQKAKVAHGYHYPKLAPKRQAQHGQPAQTLLIQRHADART
jgi:hypothetical protein